MESEQYAAPKPRRPALARAGSTLAPALVLCALAGVAGQAHRFYGALAGASTGLGAGATAPPLTVRIGYLLIDPTTSTPILAPALAVLALTGLHLLRLRTAPVHDSIRRVGAVAAGLVGAMGLLLTVVVVGWVLVTHGLVGGDGSTGAAGTDSFDASFQLDAWDTLLGQGSMGLLAAVVGAGVVLLLLTGPGTGEGDTDPDDTTARTTGAASSGDQHVPDGSTATPAEAASAMARSAVGAGSSPDEVVLLASTPVVDLGAFRRPDSPRSSGSPEPPGETEGYRRPVEPSRDAT